MFSEMAASQDSLDGFPSYIKDPKSYYDGVDLPDRVICRNVIVFDRLTRRALQQQHLANRMHHRYVLIRVLKTPGVVSVDGQSFQLNEGDAVLVAPYQFHHFIDLQSDQLRWLFITFDLAQGDINAGRFKLSQLTARSSGASMCGARLHRSGHGKTQLSDPKSCRYWIACSLGYIDHGCACAWRG